MVDAGQLFTFKADVPTLETFEKTQVETTSSPQGGVCLHIPQIQKQETELLELISSVSRVLRSWLGFTPFKQLLADAHYKHPNLLLPGGWHTLGFSLLTVPSALGLFLEAVWSLSWPHLACYQPLQSCFLFLSGIAQPFPDVVWVTLCSWRASSPPHISVCGGTPGLQSWAVQGSWDLSCMLN